MENKIENIKIRQTWLDEIIDDISPEFQDSDNAFQALATSLILDIDINGIDPADIIVDGSQDKQIDIIRINENSEEGYAVVDIIQAKNSTGFSSNVIIQIRNGLDWIFERPKEEYRKIDNEDFVTKIDEIRELRMTHGPSNIEVNAFFTTKGDSTVLSEEYLQERKVLIDKYSSAGFSNFSYKEIGASELVGFIEERERVKKQIDLKVPIVYDRNRGSLIQFNTGETKSVVCTITGITLAEVASTEHRDAIFDLNVRPYYGSKGRVNNEILNTCSSDESSRFWFLNNGVTMVCDKFELVDDPDNHFLNVKNAQIVNGCQTTVTIREAFESDSLNSDVKLVLKVYATDNANLVDRITLTTNNQNRITERDLRANEPVQRDIQRIMNEIHGHFYERKNKEYRNFRGSKRKLIVPNTKAAQAYLAIVRNKPSKARGYLGAIWSEFYQEIFSNATVDDLLVCYKIFDLCQKKASDSKKDSSLERIDRDVRVYGMFHIARILGFLLINDKWGTENILNLRTFLNDFDMDSNQTQENYDRAAEYAVQIRKLDEIEYPVPTLYYKANISKNRIMAKIQELKESE
ncbi:MAG: AIPR family protein [Reichenbachiella sp.]|uniref:AIPR family protein n=1 Tax=Reichenbachiella sp. TaxID=2184521 RepID=UPI003265238B